MRNYLSCMAALLAAILLLACIGVEPSAAEKQGSRSSRKRFGRWTPLFDGEKVEASLTPDVSFVGVGPILKDPFHIHEYRPDGAWTVVGRSLVPKGKNSLLGLGTAGEFELEGYLSAEGLGGWLMVLGWQAEEGEGFVVYNVTLKESGSPWHLDRVHKGRVSLEEHEEVTRFEWKGAQRLRVAVLDETLYLAVGERVLYDGVDLPDYQSGLLALGTYDTRYGPKPLRIGSLRIRTR